MVNSSNGPRLELTWPNKDKAVLPDGAGGFEWVSRDDARFTEVRRLTRVDEVGEVAGTAVDNLLIHGDSYDAMRALTKIPEYAEQYAGRVKLAYIDPPFNTDQVFEHYNDRFEHATWLSLMADRLREIQKLLAPDGSVWVHLDDVELHRARVVLDEIFGAHNFIATVIWEKDKGRRNDTDISSAHDSLLIYAPLGKKWKDVRNLLPRGQQDARYQNPDDDPRGPWLQGDNGTAMSGSEKNRFEVTLPSGRVVTPGNNYWRFSPEGLEKAKAEGRVWFGKKGNSLPVIKRYLTEVQAGLVPRTIWTADEVGHNQEAKRDHINKMFSEVRDPFATPKPERLLHRILHIASNPGDIVLDAFAGSGTTAAVAHKMGRRWVTIEAIESTLERFTAPRLTKVVNNEDLGGVTTLTELSPADGVEMHKDTTPKAAKEALKVINRVLGDDETLPIDLPTELSKLIRSDQKSENPTLNEIEANTALSVLRSLKGRVEPHDVSSLVKSDLGRRLKTVEKKTTVWEGGGGFARIVVEPSAYVMHEGEALIDDSLTGDDLADYVAVNLGFKRIVNRPGVTGVRGRTVLVVVDGLVDEDSARSALLLLSDDEALHIVGRNFMPEVPAFVREKRPGSRVFRAPADLVARASVIR